MTIVTLDEAKHQLRVTHDAEDALIQLYVDAAIEHAFNILDKPRDDASLYTGTAQDLVIKPNIKAAILLCVHDLYANRSAQDVQQTYENKTFNALLWPHRQLSV